MIQNITKNFLLTFVVMIKSVNNTLLCLEVPTFGIRVYRCASAVNRRFKNEIT